MRRRHLREIFTICASASSVLFAGSGIDVISRRAWDTGVETAVHGPGACMVRQPGEEITMVLLFS